MVKYCFSINRTELTLEKRKHHVFSIWKDWKNMTLNKLLHELPPCEERVRLESLPRGSSLEVQQLMETKETNIEWRKANDRPEILEEEMRWNNTIAEGILIDPLTSFIRQILGIKGIHHISRIMQNMSKLNRKESREYLQKRFD